MPKLELAIQFAVKAELPGRAEFRRWARSALRTDVSAALRVVDAEEGIALNRDYRGKDSATNVLTFEYGPDPDSGALTGDIVLCAPVVEREAAGQGKTLAAHYAHLTIHGMLHLQGYDHETGEADAIAMEAVESFIMQALGFPNPYNPL
ncbi:MAG: rRNA maturation RNase YbeY [Thiobacillaceae bacterium]|nr:rRNA maturation RNase YbeY [Thiobacillaceae bacterium]MBP9914768.1 rRNA maturation RNase YbeY [Thiobacillaceae bacterium]